MTSDRSSVPVQRAFRRTPDSWVETDPLDTLITRTALMPGAEDQAGPDRGPSLDEPGECGALTIERSTAGRADDWAHEEGDDALWIIATNPQDVLDIAEAHSFEIHGLRARLTQVAAPSTRGGPRVVRVNEHVLFVVVPTVSYADEQVTTGKLTLCVTRNGIVTAESGSAGVTKRAIDRLTDQQALNGSGPLPVLTAMLVELISSASDVELGLGDAVSALEDVVFKLDDNPVGRLYNLKREITEARRALLPLSIDLPELGDDHTTSGVEPLRLDKLVLDRLIGHAERIDRHLEGHDALLSDMLTVRLSQISVRQNEDMRKISSWAAIAAVPTLVAGVYGMNFSDMPELRWSWGYPTVLAGMAMLCVSLYVAFKKAGWL